METVLRAGESPYYITFSILRAALRSAGIPVEHIRTAVKDDGTVVALLVYEEGAEQRVPITDRHPLEAMYQVLLVVRGAFPQTILPREVPIPGYSPDEGGCR